MSQTFEIKGDKELVQLFEKLGERHTRNLMRAAVQGVATRIVKKARTRAPKNTRTLSRAIKARRSRSHPKHPQSVVYVEHGGNAKNDAFYWRFVEFGTRTGVRAQRFIGRSKDEVKSDFKNILRQEFGIKLEKALQREAKKRAK